eukprot:TRINITY_DN83358_c0_g1_i1.p1 TRINITY_DN83358_c0_g1~~TRINITY_DN83358_c0_g1_i1.p1  ORF type:complete len:385 (+),score=129.37 TRINITY_DN83358_c0_g1_i1:87-1241(+)
MASSNEAGRAEKKKAQAKAMAAAVKHLDEQIQKVKQNAEALDARQDEWKELRGLLQDLPKKVRQPIMVPLGPLAFFPGEVVSTNEVLTQLSSEWFALRTTKNAIGMVDRRMQRLRKDSEDVAKELRELNLRRRLASGEKEVESAGEVKSVPGVPGATVRIDEEGFMDIREPEEDSGNFMNIREPVEEEEEVGDTMPSIDRATPSQASAGAGRSEGDEGGVGDFLARLRELEQMEEGEDVEGSQAVIDSAKAENPEDELDELDKIIERYERGEVPDTSGTHATALEKPPPGQPEVRSPADLFTLMSQALGEEDESAPQKASAAGQPTPIPENTRLPPENVVGSSICERAAPTTFQPLPRETPSTATEEEPPKRISKFKADRARRQ